MSFYTYCYCLNAVVTVLFEDLLFVAYIIYILLYTAMEIYGVSAEALTFHWLFVFYCCTLCSHLLNMNFLATRSSGKPGYKPFKLQTIKPQSVSSPSFLTVHWMQTFSFSSHILKTLISSPWPHINIQTPRRVIFYDAWVTKIIFQVLIKCIKVCYFQTISQTICGKKSNCPKKCFPSSKNHCI